MKLLLIILPVHMLILRDLSLRVYFVFFVVGLGGLIVVVIGIVD